MLDDNSREFKMLVYEVGLLKEVLLQKENKLKESCQHKRLKREQNSAYYAEIAPLGGYKYTYECLICGQKWALNEPYEKFDKLIMEQTNNFNKKHFS